MNDKITKEIILDRFFYDKENGLLIYKNPPKNFKNLKGLPVSTGSKGYLEAYLCGKTRKVHRIIWFLENGKWPKNQIDHINGIKDDNRITNLRDVTTRENCQNYKKHIKGKLPGCGYLKKIGKWRAFIKIKGKCVHLGVFDTEKRANEEYMKKCKSIGGV